MAAVLVERPEKKVSLIRAEDIQSREDFDHYMSKLGDDERCCFMKGTDMYLCTDMRFPCRFRGEEAYSLVSGVKKECRRPRVMRFKKMLGR